jgi:hypothetical protein
MSNSTKSNKSKSKSANAVDALDADMDMDIPMTISLRDLFRAVTDLHTVLKPIVEDHELNRYIYESDLDNLRAYSTLLRTKLRLPGADHAEEERTITDGVCLMQQYMYLHPNQQKDMVTLDKIFHHTSVLLRRELERSAVAGDGNVLFQYGIHRVNLNDLERSDKQPPGEERNPRVLSGEDMRAVAESHDIPITRATQLTPYTWLWSCESVGNIDEIDSGYLEDVEDPRQPRIPLAVAVLKPHKHLV